MIGNKLQWEKVPSVRSGGKPFFYIARPTIQGYRRKFCITWDRNYEKWEVSFDDMETCVVPETIAHVETTKDAKIVAQDYYQNILKQ